MTVFVAIEGVDDSGKTTLVDNLKERVNAWGLNDKFAFLRAPGSTPFSEAIRTLSKQDFCANVNDDAMALLFSAALDDMEMNALAQHQGKVIIVDRCYISTMVYQSKISNTLHDFMLKHGVAYSDIIYLQATLELVASRQSSEESADKVRDWLDSSDSGVVSGRIDRYNHIVGEMKLKNPEAITVVDASLPKDAVLEKAWEVISQHIKD